MQLGPRARKAVKEFPGYQGELPPAEAEELWTNQDFSNFFFSSGFIRPKKKNTKPKVTQAMLDQYYRTMGLKPGTKGPIVKREYRTLALKYHPDKHFDSRDATARFQEITEAYQVICQHLEETDRRSNGRGTV